MSTGSACTSASVEPSYVLRALGLSESRANASIRLGLGRFTTAAKVDFAVDALAIAHGRFGLPGVALPFGLAAKEPELGRHP